MPARLWDQVFLLSPANLGGERASLILSGRGRFELARQVHAPAGAPLGQVFSFVSGLYFRGKITYAHHFANPPRGVPGALVISPGEGLRFPEERMTVERLRQWAEVDIDDANPKFVDPLLRHARALAEAGGARCRFVLLGSVASDKYVKPFLRVFGERLVFPSAFVGRGDMSRGAMLLRAARAGQELSYIPVQGAKRHGRRAPSVNEVFATTRKPASPGK